MIMATNLPVSEILYYEGDAAQITLNYMVLILVGSFLMIVCMAVPVSSNTKIVERLIWVR